jgi:hypothetical protein
MKLKTDPAPPLSGWRVSKIEVVDQGRAIQVEFNVDGRSPFLFRTSKFGVGGRDARTAALARFAAHAGYGDVEKVFRYLIRLDSDGEGTLYPPGLAERRAGIPVPLFVPSSKPHVVAS